MLRLAGEAGGREHISESNSLKYNRAGGRIETFSKGGGQDRCGGKLGNSGVVRSWARREGCMRSTRRGRRQVGIGAGTSRGGVRASLWDGGNGRGEMTNTDGEESPKGETHSSL